MPSHSSIKIFLTIILSLFKLENCQSYYDCENEGCAWEGRPVCGVNGITYANECLAFCQSMEIASLGPCSESGIASVIAYDDGTNATIDIMQRFQNENFILIGRRNVQELALPEPPSSYNTERYEASSEQPMFWSRFTYDGYEYTSLVSDDDKRRLAELSTTARTPSTRSLIVIGTDTRQAVQNPSNRIYTPIVELDYGFGASEGGCTGTLIGKSSVLTAAHCLYNYAQQQFTSPLRMAPGRYRQGSSTIEPYGLFGFRYSTFVSAYQTTGNVRYDMGVATYNSNSQGFPGDLAGTLCLGQATTQKLNSQTILAGYPSDWPDGTLVEAKRCSFRLTNGLIEHDCDTASAQSGAPLISSTFQLVGIHNGYDPNSRMNTALPWSNETYSSVYGWAPDAKSCVEEVKNSRSCSKDTCAAIQRALARLVCLVACRLSGGAA